MTYEEFKINLAEQVALRKQFKERLIVFDVLSKELIAEFFGFPIETYYQYSFDEDDCKTAIYYLLRTNVS